MHEPRAIPNTDVPVFRGEAILLPNPNRVLSQEEGEFYSIPCPDEVAPSAADLKVKMNVRSQSSLSLKCTKIVYHCLHSCTDMML